MEALNKLFVMLFLSAKICYEYNSKNITKIVNDERFVIIIIIRFYV